MPARTLGVDIGGTKVLAGVVEDGAIIDRARRTTGQSATEIETAVIDAISELTAKHHVGAVGIAAAGFISSDGKTVLSSPNIPSWNGVDITTGIAKAVQMPVRLENDANAAAWGEARFGAGKGVSDLLMVTVGTGIGGGIILDGHVVRGGFGIAAEVGHMSLVADGLPCGCGQRGCFEQYASGSALVRVVEETTGKKLTGHEITEAAQSGEKFALDAFQEIGQWLGRGIASACALLDPSKIVLGGGVSDAGELLLKPTQDSYQQHLPATSRRPHAPIVLASLGSDAGVIGAADLATL